MLVERSELTAGEGAAEALGAVLSGKGRELLQNFPGVKSVRSGRGVENPDKFILLVEWETMDAHKAYNASPKSMELRQMFAGKVVGGVMEHFEIE